MANSDTLSATDVAALCDDFIQAVDEYFLWDRMKTPPHQVGTLEGILIGDFGATAEVYEARRTRAAVWIRDNGPVLAEEMGRHHFKPYKILRIVALIEDPDAVPSAIRSEWGNTRVILQAAAIRLRNKPTPPAAPPKQDEVAAGTGKRPTKTRSTKPPKIPKLSERQENILQAMLEMNATTERDRATTGRIAVKAEGPNASPEQFKRPIADLKAKKLADSRTGREGGSWLTDKGLAVAEILTSKAGAKQ